MAVDYTKVDNHQAVPKRQPYRVVLEGVPVALAIRSGRDYQPLVMRLRARVCAGKARARNIHLQPIMMTQTALCELGWDGIPFVYEILHPTRTPSAAA